MNIDLKRLYYGATAFVVFLIAFFAAQMLVDQVLSLVVVSTVPMSERHPLEVPPTVPPATTAPAIVSGQPTLVPPPTLSPEQQEAVRQKERAQSEDYELRSAKEGIASSLAVVVVALPIWLFHWRRWRTLTQKQVAFAFQLYVYALMLVTLITSVVRAGGAIGTLLKLLFGVVDSPARYGLFAFMQDLASGLLGALIALLAWRHHWSAEQSVGKEG